MKLIALTDDEGVVRFFKENELIEQLGMAGLSPREASTLALKNFASKVKTMREEQQSYFAAQYGSSQKQQHLSASKRLESEVDKMVKSAIQLIGKL